MKDGRIFIVCHYRRQEWAGCNHHMGNSRHMGNQIRMGIQNRMDSNPRMGSSI